MLGLHEGDGNQGSLLEPLRRVLSAYCVRNPSIGYCQSMNFVAGTLLLVLREDDTFWVLCCIIEDIVKGYYTKDMKALRTDLRTLEKVTAATHPRIDEHLMKLGLALEMPAMRWFLSLFTSVFHQSMVIDILDELMTTGRKVLFQVAVGFMTHVEEQLLKSSDPEEVLNILNAKSMTSKGFSSQFKFLQYRLAGLDEIRSSVEAQINNEDQVPLEITNEGQEPRNSILRSKLERSGSLGDYVIAARVIRGHSMPYIGSGLPNCYVCASVVTLGQYVELDQHLKMSSADVQHTHVRESSTDPEWNAYMQFRSNDNVCNMVSNLFLVPFAFECIMWLFDI